MNTVQNKIKLSAKQKEVIKLMREGWILFIGRSDSTDRMYYGISEGYNNIYFKSTVFANLLSKDLVYQEYSQPYNYILTTLGKTIQL